MAKQPSSQNANDWPAKDIDPRGLRWFDFALRGKYGAYATFSDSDGHTRLYYPDCSGANGCWSHPMRYSINDLKRAGWKPCEPPEVFRGDWIAFVEEPDGL